MLAAGIGKPGRILNKLLSVHSGSRSVDALTRRAILNAVEIFSSRAYGVRAVEADEIILRVLGKAYGNRLPLDKMNYAGSLSAFLTDLTDFKKSHRLFSLVEGCISGEAAYLAEDMVGRGGRQRSDCITSVVTAAARTAKGRRDRVQHRGADGYADAYPGAFKDYIVLAGAFGDKEAEEELRERYTTYEIADRLAGLQALRDGQAGFVST